LLPIEVSRCGVHRDDELGACRQRALQKTVVGFVSDDTELGQWIADGEALDNLGNELRVVAENVRVLLEDSWADPRINETGRASS
jgi:hypothetical protein